jgi:hypothetical protein
MAQNAMGTKLQIGANSIAELTQIGGLDIKADTLETTTLDSNGWRTFIQGLKDGGEVSVSGFFNPGDTNGQIALYNALNNGGLLNFTILFPSVLGASWTFQGIVTGFKTDVQVEDTIPFEGTIKVSGQPSLGLTPSGGLTGLSLTGAGGTLTPAFSNGNYYYAFSGVTATSVTVTATAANHTLSLFVNGTFVQNLTSGTASNAISLASVGATADIVIIAQESGKTQKIYEVIAVKTA